MQLPKHPGMQRGRFSAQVFVVLARLILPLLEGFADRRSDSVGGPDRVTDDYVTVDIALNMEAVRWEWARPWADKGIRLNDNLKDQFRLRFREAPRFNCLRLSKQPSS